MSDTEKLDAMDNGLIGRSIRQFILKQFPQARRRQLQEADPLLQNGIVDSLGVLEVVAFIEAQFKVKVDDEDLTPENFQSIVRMAAYVERKRNPVA